VDKRCLTAGSTKSLLLAVLIFGLIQTRASAQGAAGVELGKIIVTNRRAPIGLSETTENVEVIYESEINQLPARDLSEALHYIPGIYIEPNQGFGRASSVSIQGSDSRHVRVMIDGIPLNSQASGQVNPSKFPIENAARIEVIKGAASSTWGSSLGGVVNVITKDTGTTSVPKGSLTSSCAGYRTKKDSFDVSGKAADVGYYLFSSYMESGGKGPRDDILEKKAFGKLSYDLKDRGAIVTSFGYSTGDVNNGEDVDGGWTAQPYRCRYGKIGWGADYGDMNINVDLKYSNQDIITKFFWSIADEDAIDIVRSKDVHYQGSLNSVFRPREKDLLVVGADFDWDILKSTYLTEGKSLILQAPYVNYTLGLNPWDFNLGLRYDHNREYGQQFSPSAGAVYHLNNIPETLIRANISRAFNAPPLLWKYIDKDITGIGVNPDIKPERAWVYELGLESRPAPKFWLKFSVYMSDVSDAIAFDAPQNQYRNFKKFRRQGAEAQSRTKIFEDLSIYAAGAFNDIEDRATRRTVRAGASSPRQSFDVGLDYENKYGFGLFLKGYYNRWNKPASYESKDRKFLYDLKAAQKIKNLTCFLNIYNLANTRWFIDVDGFPVPKRYFEGGVTIGW